MINFSRISVQTFTHSRQCQAKQNLFTCSGVDVAQKNIFYAQHKMFLLKNHWNKAKQWMKEKEEIC